MPRKILVVDDERQIVKLVEINLRKAGYDVICAYDGAEALDKVDRDRPDLIILDVMMPGMNGFDVLKRLQADPAAEHIPVIMLGASPSDDRAVMSGWHAGISEYLVKPFNPKELLDFVARWTAPAAWLAEETAARAKARCMCVVLVCSDEQARKSAARRLRGAGHVVSAVPDVEAAITRCDPRDLPDRIVLLPFIEGDAREIRERLKAHPPTSHVPVLMPRDHTALDRLIATLGRD